MKGIKSKATSEGIIELANICYFFCNSLWLPFYEIFVTLHISEAALHRCSFITVF